MAHTIVVVAVAVDGIVDGRRFVDGIAIVVVTVDPPADLSVAKSVVVPSFGEAVEVAGSGVIVAEVGDGGAAVGAAGLAGLADTAGARRAVGGAGVGVEVGAGVGAGVGSAS